MKSDSHSSGHSEDVDSQRCSLESISQGMPVAAIPYFVAGLKFVQSGCYVNTARIDPSELVVDPAGRLRIADGRHPLAIGVMMGVVPESSLFTPVMNTATPTNIHRILIAPMSQEFRCDTSAWGLLFKFPQPVIMGPTSELGFNFSTYGEGRGPQSFQTAQAASSANATIPQKKKSSITFSTLCLFMTDVPVSSPRDSVKTYGPGTVYLSSNVQFVIVLSAPGFVLASGSEKAVAKKRGSKSG
ncbi:hypothetical protein FPV67DRAFT_1666258 [Lyophyllum atratum]|nr:hypothetical protein FPV67DRAFT_1666258 [Lyophyllum atratum]